MSFSLNKVRGRQIRVCSHGIQRLERVKGFSSLIGVARQTGLLRGLTGYNRPFDSLAEAEAAIAPYTTGSHSNPENIANHLRFGEELRTSDYPALFHLNRIGPEIRTVFDLGGNVGNLFYGYTKWLDFPEELAWTVYDLPETREAGAKLARSRGEGRLRFTSQADDA